MVNFDLDELTWADEYQDPLTRAAITEAYNRRFKPQPTPLTHPHLYDPLSPPMGYRYDPYYECWVKTSK